MDLDEECGDRLQTTPSESNQTQNADETNLLENQYASGGVSRENESEPLVVTGDNPPSPQEIDALNDERFGVSLMGDTNNAQLEVRNEDFQMTPPQVDYTSLSQGERALSVDEPPQGTTDLAEGTTDFPYGDPRPESVEAQTTKEMEDEYLSGQSREVTSRRASFRAVSTRRVPTLTEADIEAYTREVAVERTASGFYGEDGYYYYYVYQNDNEEDNDQPADLDESRGAEASLVSVPESRSDIPRSVVQSRFFVGPECSKVNGYLSLPASAAAQESEAYLARIRNWVDVDSLTSTKDSMTANGENRELAPDEASMELKSAQVVDVVKAKAIMQYLRNETDRWVRPPIDTIEGSLVANLRVPTYDELRQRLKYEDLQEGEAVQNQSSLSQEWTRIQTEVQMSMASQARRASVSQKRNNEARRSHTLDVEMRHGRRLSNLLFLVPPRS